MSASAGLIVCRDVWPTASASARVTAADMRREIDNARESGFRVHSWTGAGRDGRPLTVAWSSSGDHLFFYEFTGGAR